MNLAKRTSGGTIINALSLIVVFCLALGAFLYFPVAKDQMNLEALIGEMSLQANRSKPEILKETLVREADRQYGLTVYEEDITLTKSDKITNLEVIWRPIIRIPLIGYEFELTKVISKERIVL